MKGEFIIQLLPKSSVLKIYLYDLCYKVYLYEAKFFKG